MFESNGFNKKLLQDLKPLNRQCVGLRDVGFSNSMLNDREKTNKSINDKKYIKTLIPDSIEERRKFLIELLCEQRTDRATAGMVDSKHKKKEAVSKSYSASEFVDRSLNELNSTASTKKVCNYLHPVSVGQLKDKSTRSNKYANSTKVSLQAQMDESAEVFVNQKLVDGRIISKDGSESKHFVDALEIFNSNKEFFTKLLQDPNSLLVKHTQDLKGAQAGKLHNNTTSKDKILVHHTNRGSHSHLSDEIVILKPDLSRTRNPDNITSDAHFSFKSIKRKLSKAMKLRKKKAQRTSTESAVHRSPSNHKGLDSCHGSAKETIGRITPYELIATVGMAKSCPDVNEKYEDAWSNDCRLIAGTKNCNASNHYRQVDKNTVSISRHCDPRMLDNAYKEEDVSWKRDSRTAMNASSLAAYDFLPAFRSAREWQHHCVTNQTGTPYYRNYQMVNETSCCPQIERSRYSNQILHDVESMKLSDEYRPNGLSAKTHTVDTTSSRKSTSTTSPCQADVSPETLELDVIVDNKPSTSSSVVYSPSPLTINRIDTNEVEALNLRKDGAQQPSPISVLEPNFTENEINYRTSPPADVHIQPLKQGSVDSACTVSVESCLDLKNLIVSAEGHGSSSMSKLVKAFLHSSKLNWNDVMTACRTDKLLDPSLFKESSPGKLTSEQRLHVDLINEVLLQTYHRHIQSYTRLAFFMPNVCTFNMDKDLALKVTKCIDGHLHERPQTLDELVQDDLIDPTKWVDIRVDAEDIITEIAGSIMDLLIVETISS